MKRQLILEDGTVFIGEGFGGEKDTFGEVVFSTGMTGYQEIISDPSFYGQIVVLTYPLVGNYGINRDDFEAISPAINGLVVREVADYPVNFRYEITLQEYLTQKGIPGISGIDTRKLTRIIRQYGALKGMICSLDASKDEMINKLKITNLPVDHVKQVSTKTAYSSPGKGKRIVLVDLGMKHGILRELNKRDCDVIVVPYDITAKEILELRPDGLVLSNGPGDPKNVPEAISMVKEILGKVPLFGICLGNQIFALACGAETEKMKFGHRGGNHPVKDLRTGKVIMTSQNHGYAVNKESIVNTPLEVTHVALNDGSIEGLRHKEFPAFTVQYHPEASPGPEDGNYLFDQFLDMVQSLESGENKCQNVEI